jgi:hypothetical protein
MVTMTPLTVAGAAGASCWAVATTVASATAAVTMSAIRILRIVRSPGVGVLLLPESALFALLVGDTAPSSRMSDAYPEGLRLSAAFDAVWLMAQPAPAAVPDRLQGRNVRGHDVSRCAIDVPRIERTARPDLFADARVDRRVRGGCRRVREKFRTQPKKLRAPAADCVLRRM